MSDFSRLFRAVAEEQDAIRARTSARDRTRWRVASLDVAAVVRRRTRARRAVFALAAALVAVAAVLVWGPLRGPEVLGVRVGKSSAPPLIDTWLGAPDDERLPLVFSDGTRMQLAPKARARLRDVRPEGARVELAHGSLRVEVNPRPGASFWIDAGPFSVHVTGTRFDVRFEPEDETFTLALEEGHVELSGCVFGGGRPLAAGQSVRASCKRSTLDVDYGDRLFRDSETSASAPAPAPAPTPSSAATPSAGDSHGALTGTGETPAPGARGSTSQPHGDGAREGWIALARRGAYALALEQARAAGFEAECARSNADELALLADVARHAGGLREARRALLELRRRFPGTDQAALAAFNLGRLDFDGRRSFAGAIGWFRAYLDERPRGPMTREALGRLMEALRATGDVAGAREVARRYLREYPSGPHAELASRVLASP